MKLALYLPNFRDLVTVKELEDLTALAEEIDVDFVLSDTVIIGAGNDLLVDVDDPVDPLEQRRLGLQRGDRGHLGDGRDTEGQRDRAQGSGDLGVRDGVPDPVPNFVNTAPLARPDQTEALAAGQSAVLEVLWQ